MDVHPLNPEDRQLMKRLLAATLTASILSTLLVVGTATTAHADDPIFVDWTSVLPSLGDAYDPNSANDCTAGRSNCIDITIREMARRFDNLGQACDHNAAFSLAYLRPTQTYKWARAQVGFFVDTPYVNHEDAVFARYYFDAYDNWAKGNVTAVPQAWNVAFNAAKAHQVSGGGNVFLGMNAHVN